ncbi:NAD(P)/FAD-dependent oxidoreductase [Magnetofaba australis]|uniref:Putative FAD dependent oxidoreductase n=1 Tax=Magnetofaba australis IT-1 TaxID=1434232 RepID=A0A1Y2K7K9_9PROT|nr:FAD-dependent oxidoreductase [Magnetofaba australis]OSM06165.1 putative FAD dependent oxidoreductase [Magnetofaba australis IT-1]
MQTTDFLIIGGGVIGVSLALEAKRRQPSARVVLADKEPKLGLHASGRNSGVLHAGFYYTADSLKARFTRDGCAAWTEYALERGLRINQCGKLVVAQEESDLPAMDELERRGAANGVKLERMDVQQAKEVEPRVKTVERALFSPATASVDPREALASLEQDARDAGVEFVVDAPWRGRDGAAARVGNEQYAYGYLINAAGLYADQIAREYNFCQDHVILPFKGLYLYGDEPVGALRTHIYPVPNLANPFLGVHFTLTADGHVKVGPTAIPAFWREHYQGFSNFNFGEAIDIVGREMGLWLRNEFNFRRLAREELAKYRRGHMVALASKLLEGVEPSQYRRWGKPGIRAQLFDVKQQKLEMDFRYEGDTGSFHVLNAVSPGFTCAPPFSRYLFDQMERLRAL